MTDECKHENVIVICEECNKHIINSQYNQALDDVIFRVMKFWGFEDIKNEIVFKTMIEELRK